MSNTQEPASCNPKSIRLHHCRELEETGLVTAIFSEGMHMWRDACNPNAPASVRDEAQQNIAALSSQLSLCPEQLAFADQTHTATVRVISSEQAGEGATRPHSTGPHDALVANVPGVMLCTLEADCLPIYLLDPKRHAIGMVHSGWRGTAQLIGPIALETMASEYGTQPQDVLAYFGPSICGACYEVGSELRNEFAQAFSPSEMTEFFKPLGQTDTTCKYLLDNAKAARISLLRAGIRPESIFTCNICTFECEEYASYRRTGAMRERMLTSIMLK